MKRIVIVVTATLLAGCSSFYEWRYLPTSTNDEVPIYVVSHGWHTGIVLSEKELTSDLLFLKEAFGHSQYYEIGWGEADFYQAEEVTTKLTLKALLWCNPTVVHVVEVPVEPSKFFPHSETVKINLSRSGLGHLQKSLGASFKKGTNGKPVLLRKGLYGKSFFFKGEGHYFITNTCNTWTAQMLDSAGVPMRTFMTLSAGSVIGQSEDAVEKYNNRVIDKAGY